MNSVYCFARRIVSVVALAMLVLAGWPQAGNAQPAGMEPQAEKLLRRMSDYLNSLQKFTVRTENSIEAVLTSGQKLQFTSPAMASVWRPNRLRADRKGDILDQEFFYDGKNLDALQPEGEIVRHSGGSADP